MAKLSFFEMKQIANDYVALETRFLNGFSGASDEVSVVRQRIFSLLAGDPKNAKETMTVVKQYLDARGAAFNNTFRHLHAIFDLLQSGYRVEVAKKRARAYVEDAAKDPQHRLNNYVAPAHRRFFNETFELAEA